MDRAPFELVLLVDKPLHWTSFDVVNKLRYAAKNITGNKKVKVGHAGTLDPLASGLVIICVGAATRRIESFTGLNKAYEGRLILGEVTPSYDAETEVSERRPVPPLNTDFVEEQRKKFVGEISQMPPMFSAKKVDGKKAYIAARKGKSLELKPARVTIERFELDTGNYPEISFQVVCSKGTYVRSLAHDFGQSMGCGAHLRALRRTAVGDFNIENALTIDQATEAIREAYFNYAQPDAL